MRENLSDGLSPGAREALLDPQVFAYETGVTLRGYSVTRKNDDWQVIFRGVKRNGENVYCLFVAVELDEALRGLFRAVTSKGAMRWWYPDKWAK